MKNRLKIVITMTIAIIASQVFGQVRIVNSATNSAAINSSAFIDASSNSTTNPTNNIGKGLIFPRTDLTTFSAFSGTPVGLGTSYPTRYDGMVVYNLGTGNTLASASDSIVSVTPGFYYYENKTTNLKGGKWIRIGTTVVAQDIASLINKSPVRDSIITVINSVAKNTNGLGMITVTNGTGATLTPMQVEVDTTALKTFISNNTKLTFANNGLTKTVDTIQLGGSLTKATTVTTSATNTLALAGLQSGSANDSVLVVNPTTGVIARRSPAATTNTLTAASSALTSTVNGVASTLTPSFGTIASGSTLGFDASGNLVKGLGNSPDSTTSSNGLTMTGKDVRLGGTLSAATSVTTSATNTFALAGLQSGVNSDSILVTNPSTGVIARKSAAAILEYNTTNVFSGATNSNGLTSTVNGVESIFTPVAGTVTTKFLGFDILGNLVTDTALSTITNTLSSSVNTMTNTTNGVTGTAPIVNSVANAFNTSTRQLTTTINGVAGTAVVLTDGPDSTSASNGLTLTGKDVKLGGSLTAATTVTTTATNTLAVAGLQSGSLSDSLVVADASTGALKRLSTSALGDKTQANNGLTKSGDTVKLGGSLTAATTVTTSATNTLAFAGLQSGASTDSILVVNPTTGVIARKSPAATTNVLTAATNAFTSTVNGVASTLTPSAGTVTTKFLGFDASGNLVTDTALSTTTNTLGSSVNTITSTVNGVVATAPAVNSVANAFNASTRELTTTINGVAGTAVVLTDGPDSTSASNGLTLTGKDVKLGGSLTAATTVTTTATNTLAVAGLQSGSLSDSLVVADATTGALKRLSTSALGDKTQVNNGLTKSGDTVKLGGSLTAATTVTTTATNTLAVAGLQSGSLSDSLVVADASTGALKRLSTSALGDKTQANNGLTKSGDTLQLGGSLTKATTVTTSATNTLALTGLQSGSANDSILVVNPTTGVISRKSPAATTNSLTAASDAFTSTVNGVASTLTPSAGTITTKFLGFDASGNLVTDTAMTTTTNTLSSSVNTITSTVNGVAATAPAVNSVANAFNASTRELTTTINGVAGTAVVLTDGPDSTTASNGLTLTGKDVKLGGSLTSATTVTTSATNTLALAGLQSGSLSDSLVVADATTGALKRLSTSALGDKTQANNGLTKSGDTVKLGGSLTAATTVTTSATNTLALEGLQSGTTSDSIVVASGATGVVKKVPMNLTRRLGVVTTSAASYTIPDSADVVIYNGTTASTFTLPAASASYGKEIKILNFAKADNNVAVTLSGSIITEGAVTDVTDTRINSKSTAYTFPAGIGSQTMNTITIISNGTSWYKLGN